MTPLYGEDDDKFTQQMRQQYAQRQQQEQARRIQAIQMQRQAEMDQYNRDRNAKADARQAENDRASQAAKMQARWKQYDTQREAALKVLDEGRRHAQELYLKTHTASGGFQANTVQSPQKLQAAENALNTIAQAYDARRANFGSKETPQVSAASLSTKPVTDLNPALAVALKSLGPRGAGFAGQLAADVQGNAESRQHSKDIYLHPPAQAGDTTDADSRYKAAQNVPFSPTTDREKAARQWLDTYGGKDGREKWAQAQGIPAPGGTATPSAGAKATAEAPDKQLGGLTPSQVSLAGIAHSTPSSPAATSSGFITGEPLKIGPHSYSNVASGVGGWNQGYLDAVKKKYPNAPVAATGGPGGSGGGRPPVVKAPDAAARYAGYTEALAKRESHIRELMHGGMDPADVFALAAKSANVQQEDMPAFTKMFYAKFPRQAQTQAPDSNGMVPRRPLPREPMQTPLIDAVPDVPSLGAEYRRANNLPGGRVDTPEEAEAAKYRADAEKYWKANMPKDPSTQPIPENRAPYLGGNGFPSAADLRSWH